MFRNIIFMGGIHGVGKSTICKNLCHELNIEYLSASNLLKWSEINEELSNKKVQSIPDTQDRLIEGLRNTVLKDKFYLLDGHYCLLNSDSKVLNIPLKTFIQIKPIVLNLILGDIDEIKKCLEVRDKKPYDYSLLKNFQNFELKYAEYLSKYLNIPLTTGIQSNYLDIKNSIYKILGRL